MSLCVCFGKASKYAWRAKLNQIERLKTMANTDGNGSNAAVEFVIFSPSFGEAAKSNANLRKFQLD